MLGCITKSSDRYAQKHDGQINPLLAQLGMPNKEMLFFFQRYRWNHLAHIHSYKSGPSTGLRLSNRTPLPSRDAVSCPRCDSSQGREESRLQRCFIKQQRAVAHWSLQLSPAKTGYRANASSTCHACLSSQPPSRSCARTPMPRAGRELLSLPNTFSLAGFPSLRLPGARVCASWSWHKHELNLVL